ASPVCHNWPRGRPPTSCHGFSVMEESPLPKQALARIKAAEQEARRRRVGLFTTPSPGSCDFDISILRTTRILENHMLQFRAEFFNAFNHPQFTNPNYGQGAIYALPYFAAGNFGQITSTSVNPRVIQLALKYSF